MPGGMKRTDAPHKAAVTTTRATPKRRSLSKRGGEIGIYGERDAALVLQAAFESTSQDADSLTHGFHTYPARMHPAIARTVIARMSRTGDRLLDPFCGSGTVLVEALVAGRASVGVDLSPLAIRIAEVHCALRGRVECERFAASLAAVTAASLERVRARVRARAPLAANERALYEPHVLLEFAGLFEEIRAVKPAADQRALEIVFSALLLKFSKQRSETSSEQTVKRIRKGLVSEFFARKGGELVKRWTALYQAVDARATAPALRVGDARTLPRLLQPRDRRAPHGFDLVLTSPPYGGTYDYHAHHALRYPWLRLDTSGLLRDEIGARRQLSAQVDAAERWERELSNTLSSISAVCKPGARVVFLIGDAEVSRTRIDALHQLARLAPFAGLTLVAAAAELRPDHLGGPPRREHLVLLRRP
jgi:hypothetical protein